MTPGPKKKYSNRHGGDKLADNRQDAKKKGPSNFEHITENKNSALSPNVEDSDVSENKKYAKRSITTNWTKYDELPVDPHADSIRGKDFEVLLSYSGGSESQLRLQDEKEWDDACIGDKSITLDLQDLANSVKCIPFHRRLNLPVDIFEEAQLERFISSADSWKSSLQSKLDTPLVASIQKAFKNPESTNPSSDIIESYECEEISDVRTKPFVLEEKTENIIESLASCLSLKSLIQKPESKPDHKTDEATADLDFLLSLGSAKTAVKEEKPKDQKQTNVDDWLNSLLDD